MDTVKAWPENGPRPFTLEQRRKASNADSPPIHQPLYISYLISPTKQLYLKAVLPRCLLCIAPIISYSYDVYLLVYLCVVCSHPLEYKFHEIQTVSSPPLHFEKLESWCSVFNAHMLNK